MKAPFKYHGGKAYLSKWIINQFPENYEEMVYLEPFCGGASVLLNKNPSKEEIINDLDENVILLLRILRDQCTKFIRKIKKVKYKEFVFNLALKKTEFSTELQKAVNEFVLRRMSNGGLKKSFSRNEQGKINVWENIISGVPNVSKRLHNVIILNKSALPLLRVFNEPNTLIYADPPYLTESRESPNIYKYEMAVDEHMELAEILNNFKGKVLLSGHPSRLYNRLYKNWNCEKRKASNQTKPKMELLWKNF